MNDVGRFRDQPRSIIPDDVVPIGAALADAQVIVVAVHGRDESPDVMRSDIVEPIRAELSARRVGGEVGRVAWLLPAAPTGRWYPDSFLAPVEANADALDESLAAMAALDVGLALVEPPRVGRSVVWVGFSQGACLVTEHVARRPSGESVAGVFAFTGCLVGPPDTPITEPGDLGGIFAYFGFGERDELIADWRVDETATAFEEAGADVVVARFDDQAHEVRPAEIAALATFLERLLDA